jgi:glyoxylase I family protein
VAVFEEHRGCIGCMVLPSLVTSPFLRLHHVAIICSDYTQSRAFYVQTLGLRIVSESYRADRDSHKLNLALPDGAELELFSFPSPPERLTHPEACGLRHLALAVADLDGAMEGLVAKGVVFEPARVDGLTGQRFTFFKDPDGLPIELYEVK